MAQQEHTVNSSKLEPYYRRKADRIRLVNRILSILNNEPSKQVNYDMCSLLRELDHRGMELMEIYDLFGIYSVSEIEKHIEYNCKHDHVGEITYSQCGWMKRKFKNGMSLSELAEKYDLDSDDDVKRHLSNNCQHDTSLEPIKF
ncbi:MAG: hypothetical protein J07AB43_01640 [Candidatus Nanosalina sp. J07AB43]|nr:MAG: hypothetical protein J07AB43_01640 [Candidatus Nanosalina sp. J07AB43]